MKKIFLGGVAALLALSASACQFGAPYYCGSCYTDVYDDGYNDDGYYDDGYYDDGYYNDGGYYSGGGNHWDNGTSDDGNNGESADLIGAVSLRKEVDIKKAGKKFADRYALSESAGVHVARTLDSWAALGHRRARTANDLADFTQRLYGISALQAKSAIVRAQAGDRTGLDESTQDIAEHWGTSPQTARTILKTWFKDQLGNVNVK